MTLVGHFNEIIDTLAEKLRTKSDGKTIINFFNEINRATLDSIALVTKKETILFIFIIWKL